MTEPGFEPSSVALQSLCYTVLNPTGCPQWKTKVITKPVPWLSPPGIRFQMLPSIRIILEEEG